MSRPNWLRAIVGAIALAVLTLPAWAQSPVGTWRFDVPSARTQMALAIETALQIYPDDLREEMRKELRVAQLNAMLDRLVGAQVVFEDGGTAKTRTKDGREAVASWREREDGKIVLVEADESELIGSWEGERLVFRYDVTDRQAEEAAVILLREMQFIMLRE